MTETEQVLLYPPETEYGQLYFNRMSTSLRLSLGKKNFNKLRVLWERWVQEATLKNVICKTQ